MENQEKALLGLKEKFEAYLRTDRARLLSYLAQDRGDARQIYEALLNDARQAAQWYPEFDLKAELENGEFVALLHSGMSIRRAYETVHHDRLVREALCYGAAHPRAQRPAENGLDSQAGAATAGDVAHMSKDARQAILRRVARGETVRL